MKNFGSTYSCIAILCMSNAFGQNFYASPNGSGDSCSEGSPCSLATSIEKVAGATSGMTADITVFLEGGYYFLENPIVNVRT
ncbi:hypothetical protein [Cellulophaga sp. L1A9]|uniref:hypothetical protein n=1 Tax=Cellulophaga sp. L1A9 TaxID=2686362 RepID=UPI00131C883B|nr:hypothetical protein [Cellulophaga sp. L1A9]